jgi:hypothetical protein
LQSMFSCDLASIKQSHTHRKADLMVAGLVLD